MKTFIITVLVGACLILGAMVLLQHHDLAVEKLPIEISSRASLMGKGEVVRLRNTSTRIIPVEVNLSSESFHTTKTYDMVLNPHIDQEIGHLEGWTFAPGDKVTISSKGFATLNATVN